MSQEMDRNFNLLEKSQRLRYEAFSVFATEINKANSIETIGVQLTSQFKFILDAFIIRLFYTYQNNKLCFEICPGVCVIKENEEDAFTAFELNLFGKGLPLYLLKDANEEVLLLNERVYVLNQTLEKK